MGTNAGRDGSEQLGSSRWRAATYLGVVHHCIHGAHLIEVGGGGHPVGVEAKEVKGGPVQEELAAAPIHKPACVCVRGARARACAPVCMCANWWVGFVRACVCVCAHTCRCEQVFLHAMSGTAHAPGLAACGWRSYPSASMWPLPRPQCMATHHARPRNDCRTVVERACHIQSPVALAIFIFFFVLAAGLIGYGCC
jgi:hypothetical protein